MSNQTTTNGQSLLPISNQWILTYYKAVSRAWSDKDFKSALLQNANGVLRKEFDFQVPENMKVEFQEVRNNDFSNFPAHVVAEFDTVQKSPMLFKVPLPEAPQPIDKNALNYLASFMDKNAVLCCCCCC